MTENQLDVSTISAKRSISTNDLDESIISLDQRNIDPTSPDRKLRSQSSSVIELNSLLLDSDISSIIVETGSETTSVCEALDSQLRLNPETLAILKEHAIENGLITQDQGQDDDIMSSISQFFALSKEQREDVFEVDYRARDSSDPVHVHFNVKGIKRELGQTLDSTGLTIWRASEHLCQFIIDNRRLFSDKSVCELGCGLGMVSILLEKVFMETPGDNHSKDEGKLVVFPPKLIVATDGDIPTLDLLGENIELTSSTILFTKLFWGDTNSFLEEFPEPFDILLAADVIYEDNQIVPLIQTVTTILSKPNGIFYLAFARRNVPIDKVLNVAHEYGLKETILDQNGMEPIYAITWKDVDSTLMS